LRFAEGKELNLAALQYMKNNQKRTTIKSRGIEIVARHPVN